MLIYNITIQVEWGIHEPWMRWMQETHIPLMMSTGCFLRHHFARLLDIDDEAGPTYAVQYFAAGRADYDRYITLYADRIREQGRTLWGDKMVTFRTLMEVVH